MPPFLFLCDGASMPNEWAKEEWKSQFELRHRGPEQDVNLKLDNLSHKLVSELKPLEADLFRVAAYVYLADQRVSRGGTADVYGRDWRRDMALSMPVSDPRFWNDPSIAERLALLLHFLTDDHWRFNFCQWQVEDGEQLVSGLDKSSAYGRPDCIILFSGGADSLCASVEALNQGRRPILVSHQPAPNIESRQSTLVSELRRRFQNADLPHVGAAVHHRKLQARDSAQRSRSFLFASIAVCVAAQVGVSEVVLADNGVVSLNLPINDQLVGALATRSTHPTFIRLFNEFVRAVLLTPIRVFNPLWDRTRAEALEVLRGAGHQDLLAETVSCSKTRGRSIAKPQCGCCSQCVDRRFGVLAAGLEEHDLTEKYEKDIFVDELAEGDELTLAASYVRFALQLEETGEGDFFERFPQLAECLDGPLPNVTEVATRLVAMLKRHAASLLRVMESQHVEHVEELVRGTLPERCLLRLQPSEPVAHTRSRPPDSSVGVGDSRTFIHSDDYSSVRVNGQLYSFNALQAQVVRLLHQAHEKGAPGLSGSYLLTQIEARSKKLSDLFKDSPAWNTLIVRLRKGVYGLNLSP